MVLQEPKRGLIKGGSDTRSSVSDVQHSVVRNAPDGIKHSREIVSALSIDSHA